MTDPSPLMTVDEVVELVRSIGMGRAAVYRGLRTGEIPNRRVGKRFLIARRTFFEWLEGAGGEASA